MQQMHRLGQELLAFQLVRHLQAAKGNRILRQCCTRILIMWELLQLHFRLLKEFWTLCKVQHQPFQLMGLPSLLGQENK